MSGRAHQGELGWIEGQQGIGDEPLLTVPAQPSPWPEPYLGGRTRADPFCQLRPDALGEIGQPGSHGTRPPLELGDDLRHLCFGDDIRLPLTANELLTYVRGGELPRT